MAQKGAEAPSVYSNLILKNRDSTLRIPGLISLDDIIPVPTLWKRTKESPESHFVETPSSLDTFSNFLLKKDTNVS